MSACERAGQGKKSILPSRAELLASIHELADKVPDVARCLLTQSEGRFVHPDGRTDDLEGVHFKPSQLGLLSHLAQRCPTELSVEAGFGMGSSAMVILASRRSVGKSFEHFVFDPWGLNRGNVVESYLSAEYPEQFKRIWEHSAVGLANLLKKRGAGCVGLSFVDGAHSFEHVIADFVLVDMLCCIDGYIVFDDVWFPPVEAAMNYIKSNRPDYAFEDVDAPNMAAFRKIGHDRRNWDSFVPFDVPDRTDWTICPEGQQWYTDHEYVEN